ncbi:MAG: hypothetical protein ABIR58_06045 [Gemmatimonadaceae bacterium]
MNHSAGIKRSVMLLLLVTIAASTSCSTLEFLTGDCDAEYLEVMWPTTIVRGASTSTSTILHRLAPANVGPQEFEKLKGIFIRGEPGTASVVMWSVGAFGINGGYISFAHRASLPAGEVIPIDGAFEGAGWGTGFGRPNSAGTVGVRASDFVGKSASGALTVLQGLPLRVRIDFTARSASSEVIRISGDAQFQLKTEAVSCS